MREAMPTSTPDPQGHAVVGLMRGIQARLILYFIGVILLTAVLMLLAASAMAPAGLPEREEQLDRSAAEIARQIQDRWARGEGEASLCATITQSAVISGTSIRWLDGRGRVLYGSGPRSPAASVTTEPGLEPAELDALRHGRNVVGTHYANVEGTTALFRYTAFPLRAESRPTRTLMVAGLYGPPLPSGQRVVLKVIEVLGEGLLIALIAAVVLAWSFVRPIRQMERVAREISKGDLSRRMDLKRADELGSLADAFDRMTAALERSVQGRMKMMADISHELNTPLAAIRVNAEAVLDGVVEAGQDSDALMGSIVRQTERITLLIDDLRELSRFEAGQIRMSVAPFPAMQPLHAVVESTRLLAERRGAAMRVDAADERVEAVGDAARITQVLQNLVNNAIQHNPRGVGIRMAVVGEEGAAVFSVEDDGVGIPPDEIESVFNRFHKVDRSRARGESGSGLGLAIVKEILDAHQCGIAVTSAPGATRFVFRLPLAPP